MGKDLAKQIFEYKNLSCDYLQRLVLLKILKRDKPFTCIAVKFASIVCSFQWRKVFTKSPSTLALITLCSVNIWKGKAVP